MRPDLQLTILIPVYNERPTVSRVIESLMTTNLPVRNFEVLVVDDGSTDGTRDLLLETTWPENVRVILHEENKGKGAAIQTGLAAARGAITAIADADLELEISDIADVVRPIVQGEADAVYGARRFEHDTPRKLRYFVGNRGVTIAMNIAFGSSVSDIMTAFKAVRTDLFRSLRLTKNGFSIEPEITAELLARRIPIHEVTVHYTPRARVDGKKLTMTDGIRVLRTIAECWWRARREGLPAVAGEASEAP